MNADGQNYQVPQNNDDDPLVDMDPPMDPFSRQSPPPNNFRSVPTAAAPGKISSSRFHSTRRFNNSEGNEFAAHCVPTFRESPRMRGHSRHHRGRVEAEHERRVPSQLRLQREGPNRNHARAPEMLDHFDNAEYYDQFNAGIRRGVGAIPLMASPLIPAEMPNVDNIQPLDDIYNYYSPMLSLPQFRLPSVLDSGLYSPGIDQSHHHHHHHHYHYHHERPSPISLTPNYYIPHIHSPVLQTNCHNLPISATVMLPIPTVMPEAVAPFHIVAHQPSPNPPN